MREPSPEDLLRAALLAGKFPNPQRVDCPPAERLSAAARNPRSLPFADPILQHIAQCSPCYREFEAIRERARTRSLVRIGVGAAFACLVVASIFYLDVGSLFRRKAAVQQPHTAVVNFEGASVPRGSAPRAGRPSLQHLQRRRVALRIFLPFGSAPGPYDVRIGSLSTAGVAAIAEGLTSLVVDLDLALLEPAVYQLGVRPPNGEWQECPVRIE